MPNRVQPTVPPTPRLARVSVSALCDADKGLPVVEPAIRPLTTARLCGPARTVLAVGEFLSVLWAIATAEPGDVLVVQSGGNPAAVLGELLAAEATRRGLAGIVVDGYVRDRSGLATALPIWARGTSPMAGRSDATPRVGGTIAFGGVTVAPGDIVVADDDGIVIAPLERLEASVERAETIDATEAALLRRIRGGADLIAMTNLHDHVARISAGASSTMAFAPPPHPPSNRFEP